MKDISQLAESTCKRKLREKEKLLEKAMSELVDWNKKCDDLELAFKGAIRLEQAKDAMYRELIRQIGLYRQSIFFRAYETFYIVRNFVVAKLLKWRK